MGRIDLRGIAMAASAACLKMRCSWRQHWLVDRLSVSPDFQVFNFVRYLKRAQDVGFDGVSESPGLPAMPVRIRTRGPVFPAGRQSRGGLTFRRKSSRFWPLSR